MAFEKEYMLREVFRGMVPVMVRAIQALRKQRGGHEYAPFPEPPATLQQDTIKCECILQN